MLLAVDTSTRTLSIALHDGITLIAEKTWVAGNHHTEMLAPSIQTMLQNTDVSVTDITALAVSIGPGSYTGLRIGIAFAKGIATPQKLPLIGITTMGTLAAAQPYFTTRYALVTVVEAGRNRIITQTFRGKRGRWLAVDEPQNSDWETLFDSIDGNTYITGEVSEAGSEALKIAQDRGVPVTLMTAPYRLRRAGFMAEEAWHRLKKNDDDFHPSKLLPIYLRSLS